MHFKRCACGDSPQESDFRNKIWGLPHTLKTELEAFQGSSLLKVSLPSEFHCYKWNFLQCYYQNIIKYCWFKILNLTFQRYVNGKAWLIWIPCMRLTPLQIPLSNRSWIQASILCTANNNKRSYKKSFTRAESMLSISVL